MRKDLIEKNQSIQKIQKTFRGRRVSKAHMVAIRTSFDAKISDIQKISKLIKEQSGASFTPPVDVSIVMMRDVLFRFMYFKEDAMRFYLFCNYVLIPSITALDETKSLLSLFSDSNMIYDNSYLLDRFIHIVFNKCLKPESISKLNEFSVKFVEKIILVLGYLIGSNNNNNNNNSGSSNGNCASIRSHLFGKLNLLDKLCLCIASHTKLFGHLCVREAEGIERYTSAIGALVSGSLELLIYNIDANDMPNTASTRSGKGSQPKISISSSTSSSFSKFVHSFFGTPLATMFLKGKGAEKMFLWRHFDRAIAEIKRETDNCSDVSDNLYGKPQDDFSIGHFVLGNIVYLFKALPLGLRSPQSGQYIVSENTLGALLDLCTSLFQRFGIAGTYQGRQGIIWRKSGSDLSAVSVPTHLSQQMLSAFDEALILSLSTRILCPLAQAQAHLAAESASSQERDEKEIREALQSSSLQITQFAVKEQQQEASWFSSKWAAKAASSLTKSISSGIYSSSSSSSTKRAAMAVAESQEHEGLLADVSADGGHVSQRLVRSLAHMWSNLFSFAAAAPVDSAPWKALCFLAFCTKTLPLLWTAVVKFDISRGRDEEKLFASKYVNDREFLSTKTCIFALLATLLPTVLVTSSDEDLYEQSRPLPLHQIMRIVRFYKLFLYRLIEYNCDLLNEPSQLSDSSNSNLNIHYTEKYHVYSVMKSTRMLLGDFYSRWARRPFSQNTLWEIAHLDTSAMRKDIHSQSPLAVALFRAMPWAIPFFERMKVFREVVDSERLSIQGGGDEGLLAMGFGARARSKGTVVSIRKSMLLEDGMAAMHKVGSAIKDRIVVRYVNQFGEHEAGIDVGGLFKDFVSDLCQRIFDPSYGLFLKTETSQCLYPNPSASMLYEESELDGLYSFLGRVLGKALFENITVQPQFAHFFLAFMQSRYDFKNLINDLHTLDGELYRNLMFLKDYEGDVEADLCLTFAVTDESLGGRHEVDLFPGGSKVSVTNGNKHRYVNAVAKYYLHDRIKRQSRAFFQGMYQVLQPDLLTIFCAPELQVLISGATSGVSVRDLRDHTRYNGYTSLDRNMANFWTVVEELDVADLAKLVKFVTSCERPPSLGFSCLQPPFTIQRVDCSDDSRLPSASTCFNILKLPTYSSRHVLREKLLVSIRSNAGFDLS